MASEPDVGVVDAGVIGLSTAFALIESGASVAVYERGVPGDSQSGGESRIFRHVHDDPRLVALARESRGGWRQWEERFGEELLSREGVVAVGRAAERRLEVLRDVGGIRAGPDRQLRDRRATADRDALGSTRDLR